MTILTRGIGGDEPPAIAGQGFSVVFEDDFDTFDLGGDVWTDGLWWQGPTPAGCITAADSVLTIVSRRDDGFPNVETSTHNAHFWQQGYMECHMRWNGVDGNWPAAWLISEGWADTGSCDYAQAEIDIIEGQGQPNTYSGSVHRHSAPHVIDCGPVLNNHPDHWAIMPSRLADNWHTYAVKWDADQVCWYIDDVRVDVAASLGPLGCSPTYDTFDRSPMFLILTSSMGNWDTGAPPASTVNELRSEVGWVRVWQR
jgi:beta-glucanase (GH16 family)